MRFADLQLIQPDLKLSLCMMLRLCYWYIILRLFLMTNVHLIINEEL